EDGIRDRTVTGVQTCALPIYTPMVNGLILASDVYHDFYRWPLLDRRVFQQWCETTEWGQLFLKYAQMGPQGQPPFDLAAAPPVRSEERRVGKECSWRWRPWRE